MAKRRNRAGLAIERSVWSNGFACVAGVDEAGRGCLAGPVVAAAVIFPPGIRIRGVNDSKQLNATTRQRLVPRIRDRAIAVGIGSCDPGEIDRFNILQASLEAMRRAVDHLEPAADYLLIDGNRGFCKPSCPIRTVIGGDAKSVSIAAASIIAKVARDEQMEALDSLYPGYGWSHNRGYPTPEHFAALARLGPTPHHRMTFRLRLPRTEPNLFSGVEG